jgi:hypothetical protein
MKDNSEGKRNKVIVCYVGIHWSMYGNNAATSGDTNKTS